VAALPKLIDFTRADCLKKSCGGGRLDVPSHAAVTTQSLTCVKLVAQATG